MKLPVGAHASAVAIDAAVRAAESMERHRQLRARVLLAVAIIAEGAFILGAVLLVLHSSYPR